MAFKYGERRKWEVTLVGGRATIREVKGHLAATNRACNLTGPSTAFGKSTKAQRESMTYVAALSRRHYVSWWQRPEKPTVQVSSIRRMWKMRASGFLV